MVLKTTAVLMIISAAAWFVGDSIGLYLTRHQRAFHTFVTDNNCRQTGDYTREEEVVPVYSVHAKGLPYISRYIPTVTLRHEWVCDNNQRFWR